MQGIAPDRADRRPLSRTWMVMQLTGIPFGTTDWSAVEATVHPGTTGSATWRTRQLGASRVRLGDYAPGYLADHGCEKGHIVWCVAGDLETELADGRRFELAPGMSYPVGDGMEPHRSRSRGGATLFIVD